MSLLEALLGKTNPVANWAGDNSNLLTSIGGSLLSSGMNFQNLPQAAAMDTAAIRQREAEASIAAQTTASQKWLRQYHPDLADQADAGAPMGELMTLAFDRMKPQGEGKNPWMSAGDGTFFNSDTQEWVTNPDAANNPDTLKTGMGQPVVLRSRANPNEYAPFAQTDDGRLINTLTQEVANQDDWYFDPTAVSQNRALGTTLGNAGGQAIVDLPTAEKELAQSLAAIEKLDSPEIVAGKDAWFSQAGALPRGMWVHGGSDMANFQNAANNVIDRSWLSARAMLKGGGPITDYESNKAENAVSMMKGALEKGDKSSYDDAVIEYEYWIKQGFEKLKGQAAAVPGYGYGGQPQPPAGGGAPASNVTSTGIPYTVEP